MSNCSICKKPFDDYLRVDCGGDCRVCLAASGDPDCMNSLVLQIERLRDVVELLVVYDDNYDNYDEEEDILIRARAWNDLIKEARAALKESE